MAHIALGPCITFVIANPMYVFLDCVRMDLLLVDIV
jgi:hypothetical protein